MRILYIHEFFGTPNGSHTTRSYQLGRELVKMGHEVDVITGPTYLTDRDLPYPRRLIERFVTDGINVTCLSVKYEQQMSFARRIWAFLKWLAAAVVVALAHRPVDVVVISSPPPTVGIIGFLMRMLRHRPFVFEMVDVYLDAAVAFGGLRNKLLIRALSKFEQQCFHQAAAVITEHEAVGRFMARKIKTRTPIETVYYPSDMDLYNPKPDRRRFRRQWQAEDKVVAVHTGSMGRINGLECLVEAADRLKTSHPDLRILAIGGGTEKDRLEEMARQRELSNISFLPYVPKRDMPDVLAAADIGIMAVAPVPVMEYCTPNKVSDYCQMGLPIVVNYGGWLGEELDKYRAGLWAHQGDLDGFVGNLAKLAGNAALRKRMGAGARKMAAGMFDRARMAGRLEGVLARAVGKRRPVA